MQTTTKTAVELSMTLADGTTKTWTLNRKPRFVGSWMMAQFPYGTDFFGMTYSCRRVAS